MSYVKIYSSILDSSIWGESHATRIVWLTLCAMADRDGLVRARAPGIALRARVTRKECDEALAVLRSPDAESTTPTHDGRRIVDTPEGVQIVNYEEYRDRLSTEDRLAKNAARQARFRARRAHSEALHNATVTGVTPSYRSNPLISEQTETNLSAAQSVGPHATPPTPGESWSTVLMKLRAIHGSDRYDPSSHREALEWIATRPPAEIERVLKHYAAEPWVRANPGHAHPGHLRRHWDRYLDGPMRAVPRSQIAAPALSAEEAEFVRLKALEEVAVGEERARIGAELRAMGERARAAKRSKRSEP